MAQDYLLLTSFYKINIHGTQFIYTDLDINEYDFCARIFFLSEKRIHNKIKRVLTNQH